MSEIVPPPGLVDLKVRFLEAQADCKRIGDGLPTGEQIVAAHKAGAIIVTHEQHAAWEASLRRCAHLAGQIQAHPWWRAQASRADADRVLTEAARARYEASRAVPVG